MKRLTMKTLPFLLLAACLMLTASSCSRWDWSLKYSRTAQEKNMEFGLNPEGKEAFVAACLWDGTEEGRRFVIPDTVEGCTVFKMGGYFGRGLPMPFYIAAESDELPTAAATNGKTEEAAGSSEGTEPAGSTESGAAAGTTEAAGTPETTGTPETVIIEEEFLYTIVLGPYLSEISNVMDSSDFLRVQEDGTVILYHPVFAFEVDEKNPAFYAEDGKLYMKKGNVLVTDFNYPSGK